MISRAGFLALGVVFRLLFAKQIVRPCARARKQTSYIAQLGVTVFDFMLFWGSEPLGHVRPTLIKACPK
jgi:hypothetical protein